MGCGFRQLRLKSAFLICGAGLLVCPEIARGQFPGQTLGGPRGRISVRVLEADGAPIGRSAMVTLRSPSQLTNVTVPTTEAGQVLFPGLSARDYIGEVKPPGYRSVQVQAITAARQVHVNH